MVLTVVKLVSLLQNVNDAAFSSLKLEETRAQPSTHTRLKVTTDMHSFKYLPFRIIVEKMAFLRYRLKSNHLETFTNKKENIMFRSSSLFRNVAGNSSNAMMRRFCATSATSIFSASVVAGGQISSPAAVVCSNNLFTPVRHNATRVRLHDQTLSEIQGEETQHTEGEPQVPAGWAVEHELGTNYFTARRETPDGETLDLHCTLRSPKATAAERDAGREDGAAAQPFTVCITRKGASTAMFCSMSVHSGELVVEQIRLLDGPIVSNKVQLQQLHRGIGDGFVTQYEGPGIFELEEPFADPLFAFLEDRGLSDEFGEFVALYAYHTEQREYINWLQKLAAFTK